MKNLIIILSFICKIEAKSPGKAVFLSAVIPGGGQFYTRHYVRGVLYAVGETYFIIRSILDYRDMKNAKEEYERTGSDADYERYKASFRDLMDDSFWFLGIWGFSLLDAYVSAHLFNFKEQNRSIFSLRVNRGKLTIFYRVKL